MPKIIENLESRLIEEAQKQIEEAGYSAVTIRSVAKACGVGVGTVYNYFPSKEAFTYGCYESYTARFDTGIGEDTAVKYVELLKEIQ